MRSNPNSLPHLRCVSGAEDRHRSARRKVLGLLLSITLVSCASTVPTHAQATRTYVSGIGKDANACTLAAPCLTLQAALAKTAPGGQIYPLDSANYGYVTITKAVSILAGRGVTGVLATSSLTGVAINAGFNDIITLQGLDIDGAGSGTSGIQFASGASLNVQDSVIRGFVNGINFQPRGSGALTISNTLISNNSVGINLRSFAASSGVLNDVQIVNNNTGIATQGASSGAPAKLIVQNSIIANNSIAGLVTGAFSAVSIANSTITNNTIGLQAQAANGIIQISGSTVTGNRMAWQVFNGGQITSANLNSLGGNINGNTPPPSASPDQATFVAKNIVTDFGAKCNGTADDAPAFAAFNKWAQGQTLLVQLTIPPGSTCAFLSAAGQWWARGVKQLLVIGYGAGITSNNGGFFLGGRGQYQDNQHSARLATAPAGASSVKLLTSSQSTLFAVGRYALITGYDLQGLWNAPYGYPSNPHFFEYVRITGIDSATGVVKFDTPLKNTYKSTWPVYNSGSRFEVDSGGPATLYALDPSWDTEVEYRGLTIAQGQAQTYANGRSVTYRDVTFTGPSCGIPTQNLLWQAINTKMADCYMEADKLVATMNLDGVTIKGIAFQSSSIDLLKMKNSNVTSAMNGTPKTAVISDSTISSFRPGAYAYGRSNEVSCTNCKLPIISALGITEKGPNDAGVNNTYSMAAGVITVPNRYGAVRWAVPDTNLMWRGQYDSETAFQITDVTQDANNTYVHTTLSGGFPAVPYYHGLLYIAVHPAPKFACINCSGSADALDLSQAPAGAPLYSYSKRNYTGGTIGTAAAPSLPVWGAVTSITFNVTKPYTGILGTLNLNAMAAFNNYPALSVSGSVFKYGPVINLKAAGERVVIPGGVTGSRIGDSALAIPGPVWLTGGAGPNLSSSIGQEAASLWPSVTIEVITDQKIVIR